MAGSDHDEDKDVANIKRTVKAAASETARRAGELVDDVSDAEAGLEHRLNELREELGSLALRLEDYAADRIGDARDIVVEAGHQGARAARNVGRQANAVGQAVREDPLPTVVALGVIALLTAMFLSRRDH